MDQPPGSVDEIQPQDLSTCSISSSVVDLTRKGEATSLEAMGMVKSPRWYPNSGNGRTGLPLEEAASSDIGVQSGDQIQSDNAFSNTTVTLSYVNRSHVFSPQDSVSTHSSLYSVPSIAKFSLQSSCESENGLGEQGYALSQHCLQHSDGPVDLATKAHAQVGNENHESQLCQTQPGSHGLNGGHLCGDGQADACVEGAFESGLSRETESGPGLENGGQCHNWPESGHSPTNEGEHQGSGHLSSSELLVVPGAQEPSAVGEGAADRELPMLVRGFTNSLEDHSSAPSPDQVSVSSPQASRPPSVSNSYPEQADEVIWDGLDTENSIEPLPSEQAQCRAGSPPRSDASKETMSPAHKRKVASRPADGELSKEATTKSPQSNATNEVADLPHVNGNTETLQGHSPPRRKLPARVGRGTRLEAMVLNICPSAYKVAAHTGRTTSKAPRKTATPSHTRSSPEKRDHSKGGGPEKASVTDTASPSKAGCTITDNCKKDPTSHCEIFNNSKNLQHNSTPSNTVASRCSAQGKSKQASFVVHPDISSRLEPGEIDFPYTLAEVKLETPSKSPKKSPSGSKCTAAGRSVTPSKAARPRPPRSRRRKTPPAGPAPSMFSPAEPEIKLKYVTYKEERRDPRLDSFSPLVRSHPRPPAPSLFTVINYPEEDSTRRGSGGAQGSSGGFLSGSTPGTSCLRPGRISLHGQHQRPLVCCLCGISANAAGLGDLHGPYYPEGHRPAGKTKASAAAANPEEEEEEEGVDEESSSDSDSSASSCSMRGTGGRQRACPPPGAWPPRGRAHLGSPAAKRARMEAGRGLEDEEDWYSAPVVPQEACEYWLHEDCGVWTAGVFLVKGKVYGLEEAVKVAHATVCSGCRNTGATLGCLFKGCPSKYHYTCALESDCVLVQENFSMRCKKHKNKMLKAPIGGRRDDR